MSRIGIFGGTFDPVHCGHLLLAEGALAELKLDRLIWVPNRIPPLKDSTPSADPEDRARMVELAIQDNPQFEISRLELHRSGPSYSCDTVSDLIESVEDSAAVWYFLIGSDAANQLTYWREIDELLKRIQFAVIKRPGLSTEDLPFRDQLTFLSVKTQPISASEVRARIKSNQDLVELVPSAVAEYIQEHRLYQ
jgi:nicotinate-nucleotide adenylyltransferase